MSQAADNRRIALLMLAFAGSLMTGCSDLYFDRRDTVELSAGDAVATNIATHTIDVWPREAGETRIVSNGEKMQGAAERYRTNKVTKPVGTETSSVGYSSSSGSSSSSQ